MTVNARIGIVIFVMLGINLVSLTSETLNNAASSIIRIVGGDGTLYGAARSNAMHAVGALAEQEAMVGDLQGQVAALTEKTMMLDGTVESFQVESLALAEEVTRLSGEVSAAVLAAEEASETLSAALAKTDQLTGEITVLNAEILELQKPVLVTLAGETLTVSEAVMATSQQISRRTADAVARSFESMTAKAIPFLGVDAVVGGVTMDMESSCATLNDLNALIGALVPENNNTANASIVCDADVPSRDDLWAQIKDSPRAAWDNAVTAMPDVGLAEFDLPVVWEWAISKF